MAKITHLIGRTRGEILLDKICQILTEEIASQSTLAVDPSVDARVWMSRYTPFDKTEMPAINVTLASADFTSKTTKSQDVTYTYSIDVYVRGESNKSSILLKNRIAGLVRGILDNPIYKTLDLPPAVLRTTAIKRITHTDPLDDSAPTDYITMCRLDFEVQTWEDTQGIDALILACTSTVVKLYDTEQGYYWGACEEESDGGLVTEDTELPLSLESGDGTFVPEAFETEAEDKVKLSETPLLKDIDPSMYLPLFLPDIGNFHLPISALLSAGNKQPFTYHITATTTAPTLTNASLVGGTIIGMIFIDKVPYDNEEGIVLDSATGTLDFTGTPMGKIYAGQKITITIKK